MPHTQTYTESNAQQPFDWKAFLNKENIQQTEWNEAIDQAAGWTTDPAANQPNIIPRLDTGEPEDTELFELCCDFFKAIVKKNTLSAKDTLKEIETRSAYLISHINNTQNA